MLGNNYDSDYVSEDDDGIYKIKLKFITTTAFSIAYIYSVKRKYAKI